MSEADLIIPKGYLKQILGERPTKYIKGSVLAEWLEGRKKEFGTRWNFVTDNDKHVLALKRKLTDDEIKELRNISYPPKMGRDLFEE